MGGSEVVRNHPDGFLKPHNLKAKRPHNLKYLLPRHNPFQRIQLIQRLHRRKVVDVHLEEFVANLHEDGVVELEERKLGASRRHSISYIL